MVFNDLKNYTPAKRAAMKWIDTSPDTSDKIKLIKTFAFWIKDNVDLDDKTYLMELLLALENENFHTEVACIDNVFLRGIGLSEYLEFLI